MKETRELSIDIIKAVMIIFMVYAHTLPFCRDFLHVIVIPTFLMATGYCWKSRIYSFADYGHFLAKRLKSIYIPFVVCNGTFALLGPVFLRFGIYTDDPELFAIAKDWPIPQSLYSLNGFGDCLRKFLKILVLQDTTQLGTATWYLIILLAICIVHGLLELLGHKLNLGDKLYLQFADLILMAALSQIYIVRNRSQMYLKCFFCCYFSFLIGIMLKRISWKYLYSWWMGCFGFAGVLLVSHFYSYELSASVISEVPVYVFSCCSAWIMSKSLAMGFERIAPLSKGLAWIGRHTMVIMCLHVLCFKLVSLLYIKIYGLPWVYLAAWHAILDTNELWKILYVIAGVAIPLLLYKIWSFVSFKTLFHPVSLYAAVGITATCVEWLVFYFLNQVLNLHYAPSMVTATVFSGFSNWAVGRILMFRGGDSPFKDLGKIYLTSAIGMAYNLVLMWFMINKIGLHQMAAKVAATAVVFAWNYMIVTKLIYKGRLKTWIVEQRENT